MKIDVAQAIGAVTRTVKETDRDGKLARIVIASRTYDAGVDDVWDAITNAERIPRWFAPVSGDLRLGGRYQVQGNAGGEITACEPPHSFSLTWEMGSDVSWVTVRLSERTEGTTFLELEHTAHISDDRWKQFGPGAVGVGWDLSLVGLGRHLVAGGMSDPKEGMAWMMSAEGKAFVRASSEDWVRASIASGTDATQARESGARTSAFYTGEPPPKD